MSTPYLIHIQESTRRLLTLLDRNPLGRSSGSFDRNYWHFKTHDFSSAAKQMGMAVLSKIYNMPEHELYKNDGLVNLIENTIAFTKKIQKNDGSFDEWYYNERGWAGPTGYIINACLDTFEIMEKNLSKDAIEDLKSIITKGITFLLDSKEGHPLANHIAIVILPLCQAKKLFNLDYLDRHIEILIDEFLTYWSNEGWSIEYDGCDPGYQTATISFLTKSLRYKFDPRIYQVCVKSLEFVSYFLYPSGFFSGNIGSRQTTNIFYAGIEYFRDEPLGARISRYIAEGFVNKTEVLPSDLDDHYMIYRLNEMCDAHFLVNGKKLSTTELSLPFEKKSLEQTFPMAGYYILKKNEKYIIIAFKKSGALRIEDCQTNQTILIDSGILAERKSKLFTNNIQSKNEFSVTPNEIETWGELIDITPKYFNPLTMILFRMFMVLFAFNHKVAIRLKDIIRILLIFNSRKSGIKFKKNIILSNNQVTINYQIENATNLQVVIGIDFGARYVPQSRHYLKNQLDGCFENTKIKIDTYSYQYSIKIDI
jgi:GR25 family glycosyltransferase involved in LPS biosynthesis